ncbi:MAG: DNA gyrase C-terminal beta-propeller domain-containing protein, partial [Candidatus Hinthialibacter sp.]
GMNLSDGDEIVGMVVTHPDAYLLTLTEKGYGKRTSVEEYRKIKRGGKGVIDIQTNKRNGKVVGILDCFEDDEFMVITKKGVAIRTSVSGIRSISRNTQGVTIIRLEDGDEVAALGKLPEAKEEKKIQGDLPDSSVLEEEIEEGSVDEPVEENE